MHGQIQDAHAADLIILCIWELQGQLGRLNVESADAGLCSCKQVWPMLQNHVPSLFIKTYKLLSGVI